MIFFFIIFRLRCDHCEYRKYGFSYDGCKDCDCDPIGSSEPQCDAIGQCPCLKNVEGRRCNKCKENKYDRQRGCIDCPECYTLVQEAARSHYNNLDRLKEILDEVERRPVVINDEDFPKELKRTQTGISQLHRDVKAMVDDNGLIDQVNNIAKTGKDVARTLSQIDEDFFLLEEQLAITERNLDHIEEISADTETKLEEIKNTLEYDGKSALQRALERAKIAGEHSDKMTKLAHEARDLTNNIESKAVNIVKKAEDVKNKSIEAYSEVKEANFQQALFVEMIRTYKEDLLVIEKKLNDTMNLSKEVSNNAAIVKNNATALLSEVNNILIPELNIPKLNEKSNNLKLEAFEISKQSEQLLRDNADLRRTLYKQNADMKQLLVDARNQQEDITDLKNDLIFAGEQANAATKLWDEIYEGAVSNYKLLTGTMIL